MQIVAGALTGADLRELGIACADNQIGLRTMDLGTDPLPAIDDLLAVVLPAEAPTVPPIADIRNSGAYVIYIQPEPNAASMLDSIRGGVNFCFSSPLNAARLSGFLDYLRRVAAPRHTQVIHLDDHRVLRSGSTTTTLSTAAATAMRLLGTRPDRIVSRDDLTATTGNTDVLAVIGELRHALDQVGSGAHILKVPHMGYRLVGTVHVTQTEGSDTTHPATVDVE